MDEIKWTISDLTISLNAPACVIAVLSLLLVWMVYRANKSGVLDWTDMITAKHSRSVSLTKFLQLVGGITGTWIMVSITLKGAMTPEMLMIYLTYVGAIEGYSKFVSARYNLPPPVTPPVEKHKQSDNSSVD